MLSALFPPFMYTYEYKKPNLWFFGLVANQSRKSAEQSKEITLHPSRPSAVKVLQSTSLKLPRMSVLQPFRLIPTLLMWIGRKPACR